MRKPSYKTVTLPTASKSLGLPETQQSLALLTTVAVGQPLESRGRWGPVEMHCSDLFLTVLRKEEADKGLAPPTWGSSQRSRVEEVMGTD